MSENLSFKEIKALKLKIEDEIPKFLDGEMKQTALDFVAYARANKMQPNWQSTNTYGANYKGKGTLRITLSKGSWRVFYCIGRNSLALYEEEIVEANLQDVVTANINFCHCGASCGPGKDTMFFGKEYSNVCRNIPVIYINPGEKELDCIKKILEMLKNTIRNTSC